MSFFRKDDCFDENKEITPEINKIVEETFDQPIRAIYADGQSLYILFEKTLPGVAGQLDCYEVDLDECASDGWLFKEQSCGKIMFTDGDSTIRVKVKHKESEQDIENWDSEQIIVEIFLNRDFVRHAFEKKKI